jgi:mannosidase alpha-like ER degradation enhancer 1/mannosidase alpha-like ER degradation enhancer 2
MTNDKDSIINPFYQLNPEAIESAYYLWHYTGDSRYFHRVKKYYGDVKKYCKPK